MIRKMTLMAAMLICICSLSTYAKASDPYPTESGYVGQVSSIKKCTKKCEKYDRTVPRATLIRKNIYNCFCSIPISKEAYAAAVAAVANRVALYGSYSK